MALLVSRNCNHLKCCLTQRPGGLQVQEYVVAGLHDHMMNWKVDLDVTGINNSFVISVCASHPDASGAQQTLVDTDLGSLNKMLMACLSK